jgi:hypothetical protein
MKKSKKTTRTETLEAVRASEVFPVADEPRTAADGKRTWVELDAVLKPDGSSLGESVEALAGPKDGRQPLGTAREKEQPCAS